MLNMINGYIFPFKGEVAILGRRSGLCDLRELREPVGWESSSLQGVATGVFNTSLPKRKLN